MAQQPTVPCRKRIIVLPRKQYCRLGYQERGSNDETRTAILGTAVWCSKTIAFEKKVARRLEATMSDDAWKVTLHRHLASSRRWYRRYWAWHCIKDSSTVELAPYRVDQWTYA